MGQTLGTKKNKCDEFLEDTDNYFATAQIVNFEIIRNQKTITKKKKVKEYQTVNYNTIQQYPLVEQARINSSIIRNINRPDLRVTPAIVDRHFRKTNFEKKICWTWQIFKNLQR